MTTISVIVCTFNRAESLRETLQALNVQALPAGVTLEIIVVNNNSSDHTPAVVHDAAEAARWPIHYCVESRQGKSYALNKGIEVATGALLAFTDDDVVPTPTWVQALHEAFVTHQADCVGGKILPRWIQPPPAWLQRSEAWSYLALLDRGETVKQAGPKDGDFLYGANLAIRREALTALGLFRTDLGPNGTTPSRCEDSEMLQRLLSAGRRTVYTPHAVVYHTVQPERMRLAYIRRWKFHAGRSSVRMNPPKSGRLSLWLARECLTNGIGALWAYTRRLQDVAIQREALFWSQLGRIIGTLDLQWQRHR